MLLDVLHLGTERYFLNKPPEDILNAKMCVCWIWQPLLLLWIPFFGPWESHQVFWVAQPIVLALFISYPFTPQA